MARLLLHHIDVLNNEYISGWCFNRLTQWRPTNLVISIDNRIVGSVQCNEYREDVKQAGLHQSGKCGFTYVFDSPLDGSSRESLTISTKPLGRKVVARQLDAIPSVLDSDRITFFMHIPKTAGTSFNNHIHNWFGVDKWHSHIEALDPREQISLAMPGHYVAGHLPLYRINELFPNLDNTDLHSFIRYPLKQLHSHLAWIKGIGIDPDSGFFNAHQPVIRDLALRIQDLDISTPAGIDQFAQSLDGFELDFFDNIQTRYFLDHRPDRVGQAELEQAVANLSLFATIGLTERYQDSLDRFSEFYYREPEVQNTRHNPAKVSPLFDITDPEIQSALTPLIRFDQQLYDVVAAQQAI